MSSWVCKSEMIYGLAIRASEQEQGTVEQCFKTLLRGNIRGVIADYSAATVKRYWLDGHTIAAYIDSQWQVMCNKERTGQSYAQTINDCHCLNYQSCGAKGWQQSKPFYMLTVVENVFMGHVLTGKGYFDGIDYCRSHWGGVI